MKKEFEIKDILNAMDGISKKDKKKSKILEKEDYEDKVEALILDKEAKSNKSEILVLNQMIE
tara:strand:- start:10 stop:195 length:186 start_codon:yes stop_codon:yes gene_type:complete